MGLFSFLSDIFGGSSENGKAPVGDDDTRPPEEFDVLARGTVGAGVGGVCCEVDSVVPASPVSPVESVDFDRDEAPMKMSSPEQKKRIEERRKKVTDLKKKLLQANTELDDTLTEFGAS